MICARQKSEIQPENYWRSLEEKQDLGQKQYRSETTIKSIPSGNFPWAAESLPEYVNQNIYCIQGKVKDKSFTMRHIGVAKTVYLGRNRNHIDLSFLGHNKMSKVNKTI